MDEIGVVRKTPGSMLASDPVCSQQYSHTVHIFCGFSGFSCFVMKLTGEWTCRNGKNMWAMTVIESMMRLILNNTYPSPPPAPSLPSIPASNLKNTSSLFLFQILLVLLSLQSSSSLILLQLLFCVVNPFHVCRISNRLTTHRKIAGIFFPPGFYCFNVNLKIDNSYWILTNLRVDNRPVGGCTDPSRRGGWYGSVP